MAASIRSVLPAHARSFCKRLCLREPLVLAPMLGASPPELVAAVANAGGLAMYGAGSTPKEPLTQALKQIQNLTSANFGVNLFVPAGFWLNPAQWTTEERKAVTEAHTRQRLLLKELGEEDAAISGTLNSSTLEECETVFARQVEALVEHADRVRVVSFHFGWPLPVHTATLKSAGMYLIGNATSVAEGLELERRGADAIIAQGAQAGGHRGTFLLTTDKAEVGRGETMVDTLILTRELAQVLSDTTPIIAAGGLMDGNDVALALRAGAVAAQMGTAFLTTTESAAPLLHKEALRKNIAVAGTPTTVVTKCFTGKPARSLPNKQSCDMQELQTCLPNCFNAMPLGRILQGAAVKTGRTDLMYMWAGAEYSRCRGESIKAAELVAEISSEIQATMGGNEDLD